MVFHKFAVIDPDIVRLSATVMLVKLVRNLLKYMAGVIFHLFLATVLVTLIFYCRQIREAEMESRYDSNEVMF